MLRIIDKNPDNKQQIKKMCDMQPLEICRIIEDADNGHIVMRTADNNKFEVMDLSDPREDSCWTKNPTLDVIPITGTITLELWNE